MCGMVRRGRVTDCTGLVGPDGEMFLCGPTDRIPAAIGLWSKCLRLVCEAAHQLECSPVKEGAFGNTEHQVE
jgi:hypothetical protein